jgi:integrase
MGGTEVALRMASPWAHPKTGIWYLRRAIPLDIRGVLGKREEKISLATRNVAEARRLFPHVNAEVERRWAGVRENLARTPPPPELRVRTQKQATALAGVFYRRIVDANEYEPGAPSRWDAELRKDQYTRSPSERMPGLPPSPQMFGFDPISVARRRFAPAIDELLREIGLVIDEESRIKVAKAVARAFEDAHARLHRHATVDYSPDAKAARFPPIAVLDEVGQEPLFDHFAKEAQHTPATRKRWRGALEKLCIDIVTVAGAKKQKTRGRDQGFTREEALKILRATLEPRNGRATLEGIAARRWVPWLCAYTGARVNEITQARAEDVELTTFFNRSSSGGEAIWMLTITPDAGSTKNNLPRKVALYPHLIEQGFPAYVASRKGKPLFYDPARGRGGSDGNPQYKKAGERLAAWVRKLGIRDTDIDPNHAWRHRFKSICRDVGIPLDIRDAIQGHTPRTEGEAYGDTWPEVSFREISKLPRYDV